MTLAIASDLEKPDELKARHPEIPWRDIAGADNIYRHDYEPTEAVPPQPDRFVTNVDAALGQ